MRIFRVLIVDDEPHVVNSIGEILDSQIDYNFDVYTAYNGKQAIEIMNNGKIDIMISDIRMPEITGIELLGYASKLWPMCKTILLTAFSDFNYAYEAIQKNVFSYLLKTEDDVTILETIKKAVAEIEKDYYVEEKNLQITKQSKTIFDGISEQILHNLYLPHEIMQQYLSANGFDSVDDQTLLLMGIIESNENCDKQDIQKIQSTDSKSIAAVQQIADYYLIRYFKHVICLLERTDQYIWILQPESLGNKSDSAGSEYSARWLNGFLENIQESCHTTTALKVSFIACPIATSDHNIALAYRLVETYLHKMRKETPFVYTGEFDHSYSSLALNHLQLPVCDNACNDKIILTAIENGDRDLFWSHYHKIIEDHVPESENLYQYKKATGKILFHLFAYIQNNKLYDDDRIRTYYDHLYHFWAFDSVADYESAVTRLIDSVFNHISQNDTDLINRTIVFIKRYIDEHIHEDVSLMQLSLVTGYNTAYLSRLFHNKTSEMLKDYIAKRKLDMIRYYMQDLELSLDEVIEKTGFNSRSYFHRFIKKETNMTPKAFRIKILCEKPE